MNRILSRIAKIRIDDHPKKMPIHEAYEYNLDERKCYTTFYLDPMDQVGQIMIKMEDNNGNTLDAINIFIPQEPSDPFMINHDKFLTFPDSKDAKKNIK